MADQKNKKGIEEKLTPSFFEIHQLACKNKQNSYIDSETGYHVLTSYYLKKRGYCCTNKCRHCPYGFHDDAWPFDDK